MYKRTELFRADEQGYKTFRIPAVAAMDSGAVLVFCSARRETGDWADINLALRRSLDGGNTWQPMRIIAGENITGPADNPVPIVDRDKKVLHFLYQENYARLYYISSKDDGETFSDPVDITAALDSLQAVYPWKVFAPGPGHGLHLQNGRLLVPIWMSDGSGKEMGAGNLGHRPSAIATIFSDDEGKSWEAGELVANHDGHTIINPSENVAVELSDGRVMLNIRSESTKNRRLITTSDNGSSNWSPIRFDATLFDPVCCASLIRLSFNPSVLLFVNPDSSQLNPVRPGKASYPRENLTARVSFDDGVSWPVSRVLDSGVAGYSDLAVDANGNAFCFYEHGGFHKEVNGVFYQGKNLGMSVLHFDLAWLKSEV